MSRPEPLFHLGVTRFYLSDLVAFDLGVDCMGLWLKGQETPVLARLPAGFEQREQDRLVTCWELQRAQTRKEPEEPEPITSGRKDAETVQFREHSRNLQIQEVLSHLRDLADQTLNPETGEPGEDGLCHDCEDGGCKPDNPGCHAMAARDLLDTLNLWEIA